MLIFIDSINTNQHKQMKHEAESQSAGQGFESLKRHQNKAK